MEPDNEKVNRIISSLNEMINENPRAPNLNCENSDWRRNSMNQEIEGNPNNSLFENVCLKL